jgi:glycosyltransferase involved in cell wall biosynthesis
MQPKLHLLALPHTQTTDEYSHCAFTGKIKRFSPMMRSVGYEVFHYGIQGGQSGATTHVDVLSIDEWDDLRNQVIREKYGRDRQPSDFYGDLVDSNNILYKTFNQRLENILIQTVGPWDIICLPFGHSHQDAIKMFKQHKVETGIGYPYAYQPFRVYESYAWYHYHMGREQKHGSDYHWVIPNYFDVSEWTYNPTPDKYLLYFGRIMENKGLNIVWEIAKHRPDLKVIICGQGDPTPYLTLPNIEYHAPIHGTARSDLLGNATAVLMPTRYVEPFGGVTVESQMTGTPVLGSTYGSFTETIIDGFNGFKCHTLGDYLAALTRIENGELSRKEISQYSKKKYDMYELAKDYNKVFLQVGDLYGKGWYSQRSKFL